ncbi:acyl-CoA dehydrogenase family protein [Roseomonas chloroacetimidivorans]|uniref:acyl-CoA dehydrogenase family protein n=1 Tax=Roseomonas chloroacetimidivorans TaxID=1766656 RepID=UPI003C72BAE6
MNHAATRTEDRLSEADLAPYLDAATLEWRRNVDAVLRRHAPPEYIHRADEEKRFPEEAIRAMAEAGWFAVTLPEEHGGVGSYMEMAALLEMLGRHSIGLARHWNITCNMVGGAIAAFAPELAGRLLPDVAEGRMFFAFALSETEAGSDAARLRTVGEVQGDEVVITGAKTWITGALQANYILTACRTDRSGSKHDGISLFLVPRDVPGLTIRPIDLLGGHAIRTCELHFDGVRVPMANRVGELHRGWRQLMSVLAKERVALSAICVGAAQAACDQALEYARTREQFGRPIGAFQAVAHKLAEMQTRIDAARLLTYRAARLLADGHPCARESSQAKVFAADTYVQVAADGVQVLGANGYAMENAMQRHYREAKLFQIFGGTSEIQRNIIARTMGLG